MDGLTSEAGAIAGRAVWHVVSPRASGEGAIIELAEFRHRFAGHPEVIGRVVLIGDARDAARCERYGIRIDGRVHDRRGYSCLMRGRTGWAEELNVRVEEDAMVCAWGWGSARAARAANAARLGAPEVVIESSPPSASGDCGDVDRVTLVTGGEVAAAAWRRAGVFDVRVGSHEAGTCDGSDSRGIDPGVRNDLRCRMGLGEKAALIGMLADPPAAGDARWFAFVLGLLFAAGEDVGGIIPIGTGSSRRGARFVRSHDRRWGLREWDGAVIDLCRVCDVLVSPPSRAAMVRKSSDEAAAYGAEPVASASGSLLIAAARTGTPVIVCGNEHTREVARSCPLILAASGEGTEYGSRVLDVLGRLRSGPVARRDAEDTDRAAGWVAGNARAVFIDTVGSVIREAAGVGSATDANLQAI